MFGIEETDEGVGGIAIGALRVRRRRARRYDYWVGSARIHFLPLQQIVWARSARMGNKQREEGAHFYL